MNALLQYKSRRYKSAGYSLLFLAGLFSVPSLADVVKDPTMPLLNLNGSGLAKNTVDKEEKKATSLVLQSVIVRNGQKIAVINNQLVKVGQIIEGYKVTGIIPYGAKLLGDGEELSLTLLKANIKTTNE